METPIQRFRAEFFATIVRSGVRLPSGASLGKEVALMGLFELAALATVVQTVFWVLGNAAKAIRQLWRMVKNGREKPGETSKHHRV